MIEPEFKNTYDAWQADPSPTNNVAILQALQPQIDKATSAHLGSRAAANPLVRSRARSMTLGALRTYDPNRGVRFGTHLHGSLQGLKRYAAQQSQGIRIPERLALDRRAMEMAGKELTEETGREPNDDELADRIGMSLQRIRKVRSYRPAIASGMLDSYGDASGEDSGGFNPASRSIGPDPADDAWARAVYDDLDDIDKVIMEHSLGMNGKPMLGTARLAAMVRRTPGAISQRRARIQALLDQGDELNPFAG